MQDFGKVAVLMGGFSSEREVSLDSGRTVLAALQSKGINAHPFDPAETELAELPKHTAKTAPCKAHWKHSVFPTQAAAY